MKKILFINACVRPKSRTYILAIEILNQIEGVVEEVNLEQSKIVPLNWQNLQERDMYIQNKDFTASMFKYAKQFVMADEIVIAAPYWDLSFPSMVKIYFEAVTINGLSFMYTPEGCQRGLCKAKKIIYVTTAGGTIGEFNLGYDYIKTLAQTCYGISQVLYYKAENLDIRGANVEKIMREVIDEIKSSSILLN